MPDRIIIYNHLKVNLNFATTAQFLCSEYAGSRIGPLFDRIQPDLSCIILMSDRLKDIQAKLTRDPLDYLGVKSLIPQQYIPILDRVEQFGRKHLTTQQFFDYNQRAKFPDYLIPHLQQLDIGKYFIPKPYGEELPLAVQGAIIASVAQFDLGVSTFLFLQLPLAGRTLFKLGSEEQKQRYLPDLVALRTIWGWALTQRQVGSNSTRLGTTYCMEEGGMVLRGNKRWIGNGNRDYLIVYGNIQESGKKRVVGGIVDMKTKGVTSVPIPNKNAFRIVQNCQIEFDNVKLPSSALLPGAISYRQGVQKVLKHSRIIVIWNAIGGCLGVYKHALHYTSERHQFGRPVSGFQLVQEKLVRMMGNLQGVLLAGWRLTQLYQREGDLSTGKIGLFKAWVTERGRLICALGREVMGGNGILRENYAMQALLDMEVLYTYEGTYDINSLVAGFELTGLKAFA